MAHSCEFGKWLSKPQPGEEVVISGVSGRFPECESIREFQENLFNKKDMVTDDDRRWKLVHPEVPQRNGKIYNINKLDCGYFGLHYRQADIMDPMTRKFLECAIETVMDAGVNPSELKGTKTAVCVGACYADMEIETLSNITKPQSFGITGYLRSFIAHRISYFLKLKGVSCIVDTACSSSLNALELGFKLIRMGKCDNALVAGANLLQHPGVTRQFFRMGVLSSDGTCKVFDQKADGYVRGDTIACIFLQRANNANRIYAQIIYSKANSDGFKPLGITFPSTQMQEELMSEVLQDSGVDASEISFMEAHGTGTEVGDPQEVEAIDCAIAKKRTKPLLIGSVKCSVGHTEPASGLNSLAKVLIALETGYIAPNIHLETIKKGLTGFEEGRLIPVTELTKLDRDDAIIGLNNFGFGGNNCHVLIRRFKKTKVNCGLPKDDLPRLVCVSGRTEKAVLTLLDDVRTKPLESEYIGLLHQIFKKEIFGHIYRGYTIVSKSGHMKTDFKHNTHRNPLYVIFGRFEKEYKVLGQYLMKFDCFKASLRKINDVLVNELNTNKRKCKSRSQADHDVFGSFAVQTGIVEMLKLLEIEPTAVYGYSFGQLVSSYYYGDITLEEAVYALCTQIDTPDDNNEGFESIVPESRKISQMKNGQYVFDANEYSNNFNQRTDSINYNNLTQNSKQILILNISEDVPNDNSNLVFTKNNKVIFLETLGRLYTEGHCLQCHQLYPSIEFPVSRNTAMISPLIDWDHRKSWYTFKFGEISQTDITQHEYNISPSMYEEQKFMTGHVIDGRNLIPATEYLQLVQKTYVKSFGMKLIDNLSFVFENCKFIRAVTVPKTGAVKLFVSIQKSSGNFEIVEKSSVVVSGKIYYPTDIEKHQTNLPIWDIQEERTNFLEQDEIYRELYLRGYNYSGLFKGIVKCNVDGSAALIKWENNWTTFLDKMLQLTIIQIDTRSLYVPVGIRKLVINPLKHLQFTEEQKDSLCPAYTYKTNILKSGGIEIHGIQATAILKKKSTATPVLEKHVFVPNSTETDLEESLRIVTQIILENSLENNFKAVEIIDDYTKDNSQLLSPLVCKALDDLPSVIINLTISSKNELEVTPPIKVEDLSLTPSSNLILIMATKICQRLNLLNQALNALSPNGFLLSREDNDFAAETIQNMEVFTEHVINNEKLVLLRKQKEEGKTVCIEVTSGSFDWLPQLQKVLKENLDIVIYSQNSKPEGILGLVNCIRREPKGNKCRCCFMMDPAPKFDIQDSFYKNQLKKQMAANIYKDGKWGTYRHLILEPVQEVNSSHSFVKNTVKGDLSSLKWVEGNLSTATKLKKGSTLAFPYYSALNFKDIMIALGRVSSDTFTKDRIVQEYCQGFEFCGRDTKGRRVMGMTTKAGIGTVVVADSDFLWEIPDDWSWQDASTVVAVYSTVICGLIKEIPIKPGISILIHSATGGIGLAAINVCLYHGFDIFVTVGMQEKRDYIKKHFPQIPESHIGNSRDESFEEMIKSETKGRGVDIVLNSLSEEKLRASVRCVAKGGNFIEIGKFDLGIDAALSLLLLERNINYHAVMLDRMFTQPPHMKRMLVNKIYEGIKHGYIKPLPRTIFKPDEIVQAYKYMTTGKHIGKVVIQIRDEDVIAPETQVFKGFPRFTCDPEKSYIIVGGLGGFGLELADWLYLRGATKVILVSRLGVQTGYQQQRIRIWRLCGVTVQISTANVTTEEGCLDLISDANKLGPVVAIFNLAVVLKDALFEDQSEDAFIASLAPKAKATIHLDQITRHYCPQLKYFVVFSSVSCGRGNAGQTNYGMANSIMETVCENRKSEGLPGLAIQWGAIGDVGLVAKMQKDNKELVIGGTLQQKISSCLDVLDNFLKQNNPIVSSVVVAEKNMRSSDSGSAVDVVSYILGIKDIKTVSLHSTFAELGMDSIMGTEMIQILEKDFEIYITAKEVRSLTFAKLMELEAEQKDKNASKNKTDITNDVLLQYIPHEDADDLPLINIPSQVKDNEYTKTIFVLPGVEGVFLGMKTLTKNLRARVLGIQYINHSSTSCVEEYAKMILPHVHETVSKEGTFHILAYSFGTAIAVELTKLLEEKGFTGHLLAIEGAPAYLLAAIRRDLPVDNENAFQSLLLLKVVALLLPGHPLTEQKEKLLQCKNFDELFELAVSQVPPELVKKEDLQKQALLSLYNRFKSILSYKFSHEKIKSQVHLFKAKFPVISDFDNDYQLSELCELPLKVDVVDGDHATILDQEELVEKIKELLKV